MDKKTYSEIVRIFSAGYVVPSDNHPIVDSLSHPLFKKILSFTDQVILILNHSTFEFVYISENIQHILGVSAKTYKEGGMEFAASVLDFLKQNSKDKFAISELIQAVKLRVAEVSDQTPLGNPLKVAGDEGGEMVIYRKE